MNRVFWHNILVNRPKRVQAGPRGLLGLLAPGAFFVLLGLVVVLAPGLVIAAVSAFLLFVGALFLMIAYKLWRFQGEIRKGFSRFEQFSRGQGNSFRDFAARSWPDERSAQKKSDDGGVYEGPEVEVLGPEDEDPIPHYQPRSRIIVRRSKVTYH